MSHSTCSENKSTSPACIQFQWLSRTSLLDAVETVPEQDGIERDRRMLWHRTFPRQHYIGGRNRGGEGDGGQTASLSRPHCSTPQGEIRSSAEESAPLRKMGKLDEKRNLSDGHAPPPPRTCHLTSQVVQSVHDSVPTHTSQSSTTSRVENNDSLLFPNLNRNLFSKNSFLTITKKNTNVLHLVVPAIFEKKN